MAEYGSGDGRWWVKPTELPTLNFHQFEPHIRVNTANEYSNYGNKVHHINIESHDPSNPESEPMGEIEWHKDSGEILRVHVNEPFRRLGVANTLFHEAHKSAREQGLAEPKHSEDRSDEGDAWAKQAGGEVPQKWKPKKASND